jgi:hypothetical protein
MIPFAEPDGIIAPSLLPSSAPAQGPAFRMPQDQSNYTLCEAPEQCSGRH